MPDAQRTHPARQPRGTLTTGKGQTRTFIRAASWFGALVAAAGVISVAQAQTATDDSGYRSAQDCRAFQAAGGGEEQHPTVMGRLERQKARFGATLPADFSQRMAQEFYRACRPGSRSARRAPTSRASTYGRGVWDIPVR